VTSPGGSVPEPVPQRIVIIAPATSEFHSRTYRLATTLVARGHTVTVLVRRRSGEAAEEEHPAGYRLVRVHGSALDGVPFPGAVRALRNALRRGAASRIAPPPGLDADEGGDRADRPPTVGSLPRRMVVRAIRELSVPLTIRALRRAAARVAPVADVYQGHSYSGIPIALDLARRHRGPAVYDAGDIYLDTTSVGALHPAVRRYVGWAERRWARRADRVITVNEAYAEVLEQRLRVPRPLVAMNCPPLETQPPARGRFHRALGLDPSCSVVLYHGGFTRERGIEQLVAAIALVPGAVLVLMGFGYLGAELAAVAAASDGRVLLVPPVPPSELVAWVAGADVVAIPIQPTTLNHRLTTPNKLFEAMAAGVPMVASDLPSMAPIVREAGGILVDPTDPSAIAAGIRAVLDAPDADRMARRELTRAAARERYNWEVQVQPLLDEYGRLTGRPW